MADPAINLTPFQAPQGTSLDGDAAQPAAPTPSDAAAAPQPAQPSPAPTPAQDTSADPWGDYKPTTPSGNPPPDPWGEYQPAASSSTGSKVATVMSRTTGSALETGPGIAGMVMGAQIGALVPPPFDAVTVPGGALAGFIAGHLFGQGIEKAAGIPQTDELPMQLRPYGVMGDVIGSAVPTTMATTAAATAGTRLPASYVGTFLNRILDYSAEHPLATIRTETAAATAAGFGGAGAEAYHPGDARWRIPAEIAAGFFSPTRLLSGVADTATGAVTRVLSTMSSSGRQTAAATLLQHWVSMAGEDPEALAALLRKPDLMGVSTTSAQKTSSPVLAALEQKLSARSAEFGSDAQRQAEDSLTILHGMIDELQKTGDPAALQAAAQIRQQYFRTLLQARVNMAEGDAVKAAQAITQDTPQTRQQLSKTATDLVESALTDARAVERELWSKVPTETPISPTNTLAEANSIKAKMLPNESLPEPAGGFISWLRGQSSVEALDPETQQLIHSTFGDVNPLAPQAGRELTLGDMLTFRSRLLKLARNADSQHSFDAARTFGQLADAVLSDISEVDAPGVDAARTFSRELNGTFTRTFADNATAVTRLGAERIPPEVLLTKALGTGKDIGDLQMRQLADATAFLSGKNVSWEIASRTQDNMASMLDVQQRIVRLAASDAVDPITGRVNAARLARFQRDNAAILDRFPEIRDNLQQAIAAETNAQTVASQAKKAIAAASDAAFASVLKTDSPADAVRSALSSGTPESSLQAIARLATHAGDAAVSGMKRAVFDDAARQSTTTSGRFSFAALDSYFNDPMRPGLPSVLDTLKANHVMSQPEIERLQVILDRGKQIETALTSKNGPVINLESQHAVAMDALVNSAIRIAGARTASTVGRHLPGTAGGSSIQIAGIGSKLFDQLFSRMPSGKVQDVLIHAAEDPKFMAKLLETPATPTAEWKIARSLHAYMLSAGLLTSSPTEPSTQQK